CVAWSVLCGVSTRFASAQPQLPPNVAYRHSCRSDPQPVALPPVGTGDASGILRGKESVQVEAHAAQRHLEPAAIARDYSVLSPGGVADRRGGRNGALREAHGAGIEHERVPVAAQQLLVRVAAGVELCWSLGKHLV